MIKDFGLEQSVMDLLIDNKSNIQISKNPVLKKEDYRS